MAKSTSTIFEPAPTTDKSVGFLNDIFGTGWENIINGTASKGDASTIIFEMGNALNSFLLACVVMLMFYVISVGVVGTAHEGEALGKRYSTLWTPIRSVVAIVLLMPMPAVKISIMQAIVLKFIFFGISGADYLSYKAIDYMVKQGGALTPITSSAPYAEGLGSEILKNLVVQEYFKEREGFDYGGAATTSETNGEVNMLKFSPPIDYISDSMGQLKISCTEKLTNLCANEIENGKKLSEDLRGIAKAIVSQWSGGKNIKLEQKHVDDYKKALNDYLVASKNATNEAIVSVGSNSGIEKLSESIRTNGWAWLGSYYWKIGKYNETAQQIGDIRLTILSSADEAKIAKQAGPEMVAAMDRYHDFVDRFSAGRIAQQKLAGSSDAAGAGTLVTSFFSDAIGSAFTLESMGGKETAMTGGAEVIARAISNGDPIYNLQRVGHQLINAGSYMASSIAGVYAAKKVIENIPVFSAIRGGADKIADKVSGASGGLSGIFEKIVAFLVPIIIALVILGATLAYYLPTLPFILWTSAIIGWLILVVELWISSSVWAFMHAIPEGEGLAGQHGRKGYMLAANILIRPALHVIGFFFSFVIISVVGHFIGESYLDFMVESANDKDPVGVFSHVVAWLATIIIGAALIIIGVHKVFSLITWLPENLLKWGDAMGQSMGESHDEQKVSHTFAGGVSRTQGAITSGAGAMMSTSKPDKASASNGHDASHHAPGDKSDAKLMASGKDGLSGGSRGGSSDSSKSAFSTSQNIKNDGAIHSSHSPHSQGASSGSTGSGAIGAGAPNGSNSAGSSATTSAGLRSGASGSGVNLDKGGATLQNQGASQGASLAKNQTGHLKGEGEKSNFSKKTNNNDHTQGSK